MIGVDLVSAARMREIENAAIASSITTGLELMERAGRGAVDAILAEWPDLGPGSRVTVVCGPGNNGGDGFVVARLLRDAGMGVRVLAVPTTKRGPDAAEARLRWKRAGGRSDVLTRDGRAGSAPSARDDLLVDAVFGTGARGPLADRDGGGIDLADAAGHRAGSGDDPGGLRDRTVALDLPSGLDADSGRVCENRHRFVPAARLTVAFGRLKLGHVLADGPRLCGKVVVVDIGLPGVPPGEPILVERPAPRALGKRQGHKYDHGHAFVLTGGVGRGGAARLAARAALRIGAGAVTLLCPPAALMENASRVDAVMTRSLRRPDDLGVSDSEDAPINAVCVGPGFGTGERQADMLRAVLAAEVPTVLDADAITLLSVDEGLRGFLHDRCLLTPHLGEFRRLCPDLAERLASVDGPAPLYSKLDAAHDAAARFGCTILLKGPDTCIADARTAAVHAAAYDRAAPWLATAGSGDILAGICAGLMARGFAAFDAACAGAWVHCEAALDFGPGLIAEDLPDRIPAVLRRTLSEDGAG